MKRKPKIRTDVPTLWLDEESNFLRIVWPDGSVKLSRPKSRKWKTSYLFKEMVREWSYYCGPLFVSKENEP